MADCSKLKDFITESTRLCTTVTKNAQLTKKLSCMGCPLYYTIDNTKYYCLKRNTDNENFIDEAINRLQKWSNEHPQKTYLTEFLKHYPNADLIDDGYPSDICVAQLGLCEDCEGYDENGTYITTRKVTCKECWNTPIE